MIAVMVALVSVLAPVIDLPPDLPIEVIAAQATVDPTATAERGTQVQVEPTSPPPDEPSGPPQGNESYSNGRCTGWEAKLAYYSPGWSVERMSRIMYRESRCRAGAHNSAGANGLLQVMRSNCPFIARQLGESCSADKLRTADFNIRAARELFQYDGYGPWAATR
jgi:hypothetical protein